MDEEFNALEKIDYYIRGKKKIPKIIALFLKAKRAVPENQEQLNRIFKRHAKEAKELDCYSVSKIVRAMKYLIDTADYKWTLGSVIKCIDEDFDALEGKKPIIQLSNGESIYSVERLKQLERDGVIFYDGKTWKEISN